MANKSNSFSTRFTEVMDEKLNILSEIMMVNKHEIVRTAISEYIVKNKYLIDESIKHKKEYEKYDYYTFSNEIEKRNNYKSTWILGIKEDEKHVPLVIDELVKVEITERLQEEAEKIQEYKKRIGDLSEEKIKELEKKLFILGSSSIVKEYNLQFTELGLEVKDSNEFIIKLHEYLKEVDES